MVTEIQEVSRMQKHARSLFPDYRVGFVPTLGALHPGHRALLSRARSSCDRVIASIFVNPTQFDTDEDAEAYPRDPEQDREVLHEEGVDVLFRPSYREIYPKGDVTEIQTDLPMQYRFEGAYRPRFFKGVARVVTKLLNAVPAHCVFFGEKDLQQVLLVRQIARDLRFEQDIELVPVERDEEGVAFSSRNRNMTSEDRDVAVEVARLMREIETRADEMTPEELQTTWWKRFEEAGMDVQYLETVAWPGYESCEPARDEAILIVAGHIGSVRLKDNNPLHYESVRALEESRDE